MPTTAVPGPLLALLEAHASAYAPQYPPANHTDHGPMACLALHGLGFEQTEIERFSASYSPRLAPLRASQSSLRADDWLDHRGRRESYPALLSFFNAQVRLQGGRDTAGRYLPLLVSGWVKDLFHPLIRLGYGLEFDVPSEIAAGLAYLACVGDDPQLLRGSQSPAIDARGAAYLSRLQTHRAPGTFDGPDSFNRRYQHIMDGWAHWPAGGPPGTVRAAISRACLEIFHERHDFFALHLVTASHAFHVCAPLIGPLADGLFSVGLGAAYLALGAPMFRPLPRVLGDLPLDTLKGATDEHVIKLAYSCRVLARAYADPTYEWVATQYLDARR